MIKRIEDLGDYDLETEQVTYSAMELCDLTQVQVEELLSAGLADEEESVDAKGVARELEQQGLGFLP